MSHGIDSVIFWIFYQILSVYMYKYIGSQPWVEKKANQTTHFGLLPPALQIKEWKQEKVIFA